MFALEAVAQAESLMRSGHFEAASAHVRMICVPLAASGSLEEREAVSHVASELAAILGEGMEASLDLITDTLHLASTSPRTLIQACWLCSREYGCSHCFSI
jgi:hypothetical protein